MILSPKQTEAMNAIASERYEFILFGGAMGGGKTIWELTAFLIMCEVFPKSRWCVIRENLEKIRTTTIPSFKKLGASGKLRESPYEYTHPNGSQIIFKGENFDNDKELDWMKGLEVNGIGFEEINECTQQAFELAFARVGRWECNPRPKPIVLATCNPSSGWVKELVYDRHENGTLPKKWLYIQSKVTDNPHLTPEYLENLNNMSRYRYDVFVNGNWNMQLKVGGEFYRCFELEQHVAAVKYDPLLPLHISFDDNVNPYLSCGIFQIKINALSKTKELIMIDEIVGKPPMNKVDKVCQEFKRRYPNHQSGLFLYGDATASKEDTKTEEGMNFFRLILDSLRTYKPSSRVMSSNPSVVMRGNFINTVFEKETQGIKVIIGENCKTTIEDFIKLKEAADGTKSKEMETNPLTKVRYQKYGHFTDLFDYFICSAFASEYARYQAGDVSASIKTGRSKPSKNSY